MQEGCAGSFSRAVVIGCGHGTSAGYSNSVDGTAGSAGVSVLAQGGNAANLLEMAERLFRETLMPVPALAMLGLMRAMVVLPGIWRE